MWQSWFSGWWSSCGWSSIGMSEGGDRLRYYIEGAVFVLILIALIKIIVHVL